MSGPWKPWEPEPGEKDLTAREHFYLAGRLIGKHSTGHILAGLAVLLKKEAKP